MANTNKPTTTKLPSPVRITKGDRVSFRVFWKRDGKRVSKTFATEAQAQDHVRTVVAADYGVTVPAPKPERLKIRKPARPAKKATPKLTDAQKKANARKIGKPVTKPTTGTGNAPKAQRGTGGMDAGREAWLCAGANAIVPIFEAAGYDVPAVRISVGWTSKGGRGKAIGQCWDASTTTEKIAQIFIVPTIDDGSRVLDILAHEMVHATVGCDAKHGKLFRKCAEAIGLEGKMTATVAGDALKAKLDAIVAKIGEYPHSAITPNQLKKKTQTTRMRKVICRESDPASDTGVCGYTVRTTKKWLDVAVPCCPIHGTTMHVVDPDAD